MEPARLIDELLALPDDGWEEWLCRHAARLSLAVVAERKQRSDQRIKDDTEQAERLTRAALAVARQLPAEPLAWALANWARGNWAAYQEAKQAVDCYLTALPAYVQAADYLAVDRLCGNLVGVYATLGRFAEADQAYSQAKASFARAGDAAVEYQLSCDLNYGFSLLEQGRCREALAINGPLSRWPSACSSSRHLRKRRSTKPSSSPALAASTRLRACSSPVVLR